MPKYKANIILENDNWLIVQPLSHSASAFYAKDTYWAIGPIAKGGSLQVYFKAYTAKGPIFIVMNKNESEDSEVKRMGFHFETATFVNVLNTNFNPKEYFDKHPEVFIAIESHMSEEGKKF